MPAQAELLFQVDRHSDLPVGVQIAWRIRALIAAGKLPPGEQLPSVRELAEVAGINANTARAVYGRLEAEGLLASRHGSGTFVAPDVASSGEVERIAADAVAD